MKLTDDFVKQVKHRGGTTGDRYADGGGLYLLVKAAGKYWRMDYRFANKRKTLALGVYPAASLDDARSKANDTREMLNDGIDPCECKKEIKQAQRAEVQGQRPRHPGAVLRDVVLPGLSITAESLAELLNLPFDGIIQIINERAPMTCVVAVKLERLISIKAEIWLTLQQTVDLWDARTEFKRFQDFGKSLKLSDFDVAPDSMQGDLNASSTVLLTRAVAFKKAEMDLNGFNPTKG